MKRRSKDGSKKKARSKNSSTYTIAHLECYFRDEPLAKEKVKRVDTPVCIYIHSKRKRLTDADGVSAKAAIDGLVISGILEDDNTEYVTRVEYSQEKL